MCWLWWFLLDFCFWGGGGFLFFFVYFLIFFVFSQNRAEYEKRVRSQAQRHAPCWWCTTSVLLPSSCHLKFVWLETTPCFWMEKRDKLYLYDSRILGNGRTKRLLTTKISQILWMVGAMKDLWWSWCSRNFPVVLVCFGFLFSFLFIFSCLCVICAQRTLDN